MKKRVLMSMLILVSVLAMLPAATDPPKNTPPKKDFLEEILNVNMIVNDVLFAGFSSNKVTEFLPVTGEVDKIMMTDAGDIYRSRDFYVYGMASSFSTISMKFRYGAKSQDPAKPQSREGLMYSSDGSNAAKIPITLTWDNATPSDTLPLEIPIIQKSNPAKVHSNVACTDRMWFEIDKAAVEQVEGVAGSYKADLVIEIWIDGENPNEGAEI